MTTATATATATSTTTGARRVLILVGGAPAGSALREAVGTDEGGSRTSVHLVVPAFDSRLRRPASGEDGARRFAKERLELCLGDLAAAGIAATGAVGDPDPFQAIEDSLLAFAADEIVIAAAPVGPRLGLGADVAEQAMCRFGLPVAHLRSPARRAPAADDAWAGGLRAAA